LKPQPLEEKGKKELCYIDFAEKKLFYIDCEEEEEKE